jgi:hypothetical protein
LQREIKFVSHFTFSEFLEEAKKISPTNDFPYVALVLKIKDKATAELIEAIQASESVVHPTRNEETFLKRKME